LDAIQKTFWCCSKCGRIHEEQAVIDQCCVPQPCERCGKEKRQHPYTVCKNCKFVRDQEREREKFEKAEKIPEAQWDGPVFSEDWDEEDGYSESVSDMLNGIIDNFHGVSREEGEAYKARGDDESEFDWACRFIPEYVWACDIRHPHVDAQNVIEGICEDLYDDAYDAIVGHDDLQKALDAWCAQQTVTGWEINYKKAVVIDRAYWVEELRKSSIP